MPREAKELRILEELAAAGALIVEDHRFELIEEQLVGHPPKYAKAVSRPVTIVASVCRG